MDDNVLSALVEVTLTLTMLSSAIDVSQMRNKCIQFYHIYSDRFPSFALLIKMAKPKRQHNDRTLKEKIQILDKLDCGVKAIDLCKQFNLCQSTISTWKKQRSKLKGMVDDGKVLDTRHNRESFLPQEERALHLWFCEMRSKPHAPLINQALLIQTSTL